MVILYSIDSSGIHRPDIPIQHRDDEFDQEHFDILYHMQTRHFWYRGRHRFLLSAFDRFVCAQTLPISAIDLGGGVGGWLRYLVDRRDNYFKSIALADSSETALRLAKNVLPERVERYQVDLMSLRWERVWDVAFMLDVIEHIPNDLEAVCQAAKVLKSGGYLFVTTPALNHFWSYNDELNHHQRRYNRKDFAYLAHCSGLELCDSRYFMFFLSPLYWLHRHKENIYKMSLEEKHKLMRDTHNIPFAPINSFLAMTFGSETPLGHWLHFPWGTSILGVFRKP